MKKNFLKIYFFILSSVICINLHAQHFDSALKRLNTEYRQEKLYLQFNRSVYNAGETIWFKAYIFAGNFPSLISKTLYTELTDAKGKLIRRIISPVIISSASGSIDIPTDVGGTVYVRSYTKWMLNFDSSFLFSKTLSIIPSQKTLPKVTSSSQTRSNNTAPVTSSIVLQFFPEGGDLVQNIESRIAFKATDRRGDPVNISGDIVDSKGKKVTSFISIHDGMGTFILTPESSEQYKAVWNDKGQTHETQLPSAKQSGVVMQTENLQNQIEFKIKRAANIPYPYVVVVAQMNQQLLYRAKVNISKTEIASGNIPLENVPAGIVQITIFTPDEKPVAERLVFANATDYTFPVKLNTPVTDTNKRGKNIIELDIPDTLLSNLSVAVTDADLEPLQTEDNIYSRLLLTDDIKGYVYDPAYYFSSDADSVANHLDLVMMTNGWRRFNWEDALAGRFPVLNYLPENYISVEGQIKDINKKLFAGKEINGILQLKNKGKGFLNTSVQTDGRFAFTGMVFYDTATLFYDFNKDKKSTLTTKASFDIKSNLIPDPLRLPTANNFTPDVNDIDSAIVIKNKDVYQQHLKDIESHKVIVLKTVEVTTKTKTKQQLMDEEYTTGYFSDDPSISSTIILPEDDPAFLASQNIASYLKGRIAGLEIYLDGHEAYIKWRGFETSLFVNEIPQSSVSFETGKFQEDPSYMLSIPMSDIAMVKIFHPPFFGAGSVSAGGEGGAIAVYTKKGNEGSVFAKGLNFITLPGYTPVKQFYSPDYSMPEHSNAADYRTTLYWNPFVITDKTNRHISLPFYNNDITKRMRVIIEGCNEDGKLIRIEKMLE